MSKIVGCDYKNGKRVAVYVESEEGRQKFILDHWECKVDNIRQNKLLRSLLSGIAFASSCLTGVCAVPAFMAILVDSLWWFIPCFFLTVGCGFAVGICVWLDQ